MKDRKIVASTIATGLLVLPAALPAIAYADVAPLPDSSKDSYADDGQLTTLYGPVQEPVDVYGPAEPVKDPDGYPDIEQNANHNSSTGNANSQSGNSRSQTGEPAKPEEKKQDSIITGKEQVIAAIGGAAVLAAVGGGAAVAMSRGNKKKQQGDLKSPDPTGQDKPED